jgi:hypothetical protein
MLCSRVNIIVLWEGSGAGGLAAHPDRAEEVAAAARGAGCACSPLVRSAWVKEAVAARALLPTHSADGGYGV